MLSMQSKTKSGWPDKISSSDDASYNSTFASMWHSGKIEEKCFLRHKAFGVPTSARVATACRLSDETDTFSHSEQIISTFCRNTYNLNTIETSLQCLFLFYLFFFPFSKKKRKLKQNYYSTFASNNFHVLLPEQLRG